MPGRSSPWSSRPCSKALLLDEPTSAPGVSVPAQIIALPAERRRHRGLAFLFVSHNLAVMRQLCERVAVTNQGGVAEQGLAEVMLVRPQHPDTRTLGRAVLPPRPRRVA